MPAILPFPCSPCGRIQTFYLPPVLSLNCSLRSPMTSTLAKAMGICCLLA
jgi:hypothetical protein